MQRWFYKDHFFPREIEKDPAYQNYPQTWRRLYLLVCRRSYLTRHSPTRRYCQWTYGQLAEQVGLSRRQVKRIMKRLMEDKLIFRWYAGDSGTNTPDGKPRPPRYEIPASRGMIKWWRRVRKPRKKTSRDKREVKHESKRFKPGPGRVVPSGRMRHAPEGKALDQGGKDPPGG